LPCGNAANLPLSSWPGLVAVAANDVKVGRACEAELTVRCPATALVRLVIHAIA